MSKDVALKNGNRRLREWFSQPISDEDLHRIERGTIKTILDPGIDSSGTLSAIKGLLAVAGVHVPNITKKSPEVLLKEGQEMLRQRQPR